MIKYTTAWCDKDSVAEWLKDEDIHVSRIISSQQIEEDRFLIWYN